MKKFYFNPKSGNMNLEKPSEFKDAIKALPEKRHAITIKKYSQTRTLTANGYYWSVVIPYFMDEMGLVNSESNKKYMHDDVLGQELRLIDDELRPGKKRLQQTSTMTGSEFWKYIHQCGLLFHDYFNGSFPPPKSLGYDGKN